MKNADSPAMPIGEQMDAMHLNAKCNGLTKREHFAAMAMQGLISAHDRNGEWTGLYPAVEAVAAADALLAELESTK